MTDREQVRELLKEDGINFIVVQFVDLHGSAKAKMVPVECFDDVIDVGAGFAGGALWGVGQGPHSHDLMPGTARFAAELHVDEKPHPFCSRTHLRHVLKAAAANGYVFNVGMEPEFFL